MSYNTVVLHVGEQQPPSLENTRYRLDCSWLRTYKLAQRKPSPRCSLLCTAACYGSAFPSATSTAPCSQHRCSRASLISSSLTATDFNRIYANRAAGGERSLLAALALACVPQKRSTSRVPLRQIAQRPSW